MNAIVLVMDRLHVGHVGAYGNSWIETPALDRAAAESFLFDQYLIDSPDLGTLYRSFWQGCHAMESTVPDSRPALPELLAKAGVASTLLTDEPVLVEHPLSERFDSIVELDSPELLGLAEQIEETHLARFFARAIDWLESPPEQPFLLWCHATAMDGPWDAPWSFRSHYAEADDPDPPKSAEVPRLLLDKDYDPDQLLGICQSYSGQVSLLDTCFGAFWEFLQSAPWDKETLVVLVSARGFPLGEHRRVGPLDDALHGELVHAPLWLRFPDATGAAARSQALVQPGDLCATLADWWQTDRSAISPTVCSLMPWVRQSDEPTRDRVGMINIEGSRAIRTPAWYLHQTSEAAELYRKPDDRWEVNDVATRCHHVVESLEDHLDRYEAALQSGRSEPLPPLDETLLHGLE